MFSGFWFERNVALGKTRASRPTRALGWPHLTNAKQGERERQGYLSRTSISGTVILCICKGVWKGVYHLYTLAHLSETIWYPSLLVISNVGNNRNVPVKHKSCQPPLSDQICHSLLRGSGVLQFPKGPGHHNLPEAYTTFPLRALLMPAPHRPRHIG